MRPRALPALGVLLAGFAPAQDRPARPFSYPPTRAGIIAGAYVDALNAGTDAAALAFEKRWRAAAKLEERPPDQRAPLYRQIRSVVGTLEPLHVVASKADEIVFVAKSAKTEMWLQLTLTLESAPPHKLLSLEIRPTAGPRVARIENWKDLTDLLTQARGAERVPALAAAVVVGDALVDSAVVGVRDLDAETPAARGDRFHIGSLSKAVTATMLGRLVQRGELSWDLALADALPHLTMRPEYRAVTLEDLLHHRAGLVAMATDDEDFAPKLEGDGRAQRGQLADALLTRPAAVAPKSAFWSSNAGYALAAHIAELRMDQSWEELVAEHVFTPLQLKTAAPGWPARPGGGDQPRGHVVEDDELAPQPLDAPALDAALAPAGDLSCSIEDLARFAGAHLRGLRGEPGPFDAELIARLHTPPPATGGSRYAAGWLVEDRDGAPIHWHAGSAGSFYTVVEVHPAANCAIAIAANAAHPDTMGAVQAVLAALRARYVASK